MTTLQNQEGRSRDSWGQPIAGCLCLSLREASAWQERTVFQTPVVSPSAYRYANHRLLPAAPIH
ncbi:hypothetical protein RvY_06651 [Ramazzottius varieornatus]|uniref:Uncharacterized protein n=1 Tax=Ramazzottius varieornatus TaxID=947166 RepID=A0A1D1V2P8_RAMVA|nr:hypothetical protein RvY_06651 [Ramazzottius varieornatus]